MKKKKKNLQRKITRNRDGKEFLYHLVKALDADLVMLAKDEYAQTNGFTTKAERASRRLMNLVALVEPDLIDTGGQQ